MGRNLRYHKGRDRGGVLSRPFLGERSCFFDISSEEKRTKGLCTVMRNSVLDLKMPPERQGILHSGRVLEVAGAFGVSVECLMKPF